MGAALLKDRPIAFASKSLTPTQSSNSNVEREALALVHGVQRFHTYLYDRRFTVITEHKPLVMIHQKLLNRAPPRLQRMLLKLTGYDFEVIYRPDSEMILADTLSRLQNPAINKEVELDVRIDNMDIKFDLINVGSLKQELKRHQC